MLKCLEVRTRDTAWLTTTERPTGEERITREAHAADNRQIARHRRNTGRWAEGGEKKRDRPDTESKKRSDNEMATEENP